MTDPFFLLMVVLSLSLGSIAKGVTGIGLPLLAVPLLSAIVGVEHAVVVMVIPSVASNGWLIWVHRHHAPPVRALGPFLFFGMIGGVAGTWLLAVTNDLTLTRILATWLGLYLVLTFTQPDFRLRGAEKLAPFFGFASGTMQGATGISAPIITPFLHGIGLNQRAFIFSMSLSFTAFSIMQTSAMVVQGLFTAGRLVEGLVALIPVMLSLHFGVKLSRLISANTFRRFLLFIFILMEMRLIWASIYPWFSL
ncbi:hypothetical protein JCM17844_21730 [Iodidimonas gelatinilytica]|uniref:Probable membrane transporter protein n=1 Tax=Iodidimonas gelatinilytica TaxID=1236966 RepID=A0A5A7MS14_9PROT|nr:sulfite exporter TauE/SafE family protein [Iodidimonas gelatinilytica]GEQ98536.1 hypothetical protein JCM17844_21730 [Iodidimonas gelatinilytica]